MAVVLVLAQPDSARDTLVSMLRAHDHEVRVVPDIAAAATEIGAGGIALVIAGSPLIGSTGMRWLRGTTDVPVVAATEPDLLARHLAGLRRGSAREDSGTLVVGELRLDPDLRLATFRGRPLRLSPREFDLLAYLATHLNHVVGRAELLDKLWPRSPLSSGKTLDVHIHRLRRKLGESARRPSYLHTVPGIGFVMPTQGAATAGSGSPSGVRESSLCGPRSTA